MTTNKPEVVAWYTPATRYTLPVVALDDRSQRGEPLIRLSDYEALQADYERLRKQLQNLIDQTTPLVPEPGNPMWSRRIQLDEVIAERDSLRAECEKLRNLLVEIEIGCSRRDMPSEQTISSWADAIDAAMGYDENDRDSGYRSALRFHGIERTPETDRLATDMIYRSEA